MEIYKFSYDALNSLSKYYGISVEKIKIKLREIKKLIDQNKAVGGDQGMSLLNIRLLLNAKPEKKIIKARVSYYHHTTSDDTPDWFQDGLLSNKKGLDSYITKIKSLIPNLLTDSVIDESFFKKEDLGAHAYSRLEEAKIDSSYDFPDFFRFE